VEADDLEYVINPLSETVMPSTAAVALHPLMSGTI